MLSDLLFTFVWFNKNIHVYRRLSTLIGLNERKNRILSATELQGDLELLEY
jgi:hypothetical protein